MKPTETTIEHPVMTCPACDQQITAMVTVLPKLGEPKIRGAWAVDMSITAEVVRFNLRHNCQGKVYAEVAANDEETAHE